MGAAGWICVGIVVIALLAAIGQIMAQNRAKEAYLASLEKLKRDPHNPDLREDTLALGRKYANLARNRRGVALFDEVALMNDINAACARAGSKVKIEADHRRPSVEERLANLDGLWAKRLISEQEYRARREQILDEI
jgi:hypothetical protein